MVYGTKRRKGIVDVYFYLKEDIWTRVMTVNSGER